MITVTPCLATSVSYTRLTSVHTKDNPTDIPLNSDNNSSYKQSCEIYNHGNQQADTRVRKVLRVNSNLALKPNSNSNLRKKITVNSNP